MSARLRQTSAQYASEIEALNNQISDAENNVVSFKATLVDITAAKDAVDKLIAAEPADPKASPAS